jgi:hypothetical protein
MSCSPPPPLPHYVSKHSILCTHILVNSALLFFCFFPLVKPRSRIASKQTLCQRVSHNLKRPIKCLTLFSLFQESNEVTLQVSRSHPPSPTSGEYHSSAMARRHFKLLIAALLFSSLADLGKQPYNNFEHYMRGWPLYMYGRAYGQENYSFSVVFERQLKLWPDFRRKMRRRKKSMKTSFQRLLSFFRGRLPDSILPFFFIDFWIQPRLLYSRN